MSNSNPVIMVKQLETDKPGLTLIIELHLGAMLTTPGATVSTVIAEASPQAERQTPPGKRPKLARDKCLRPKCVNAVWGRADKLYCNPSCRALHNEEKKARRR